MFHITRTEFDNISERVYFVTRDEFVRIVVNRIAPIWIESVKLSSRHQVITLIKIVLVLKVMILAKAVPNAHGHPIILACYTSNLVYMKKL